MRGHDARFVAAGDGGLPSPRAREMVRATAGLADVVASLLLALHPGAELYRIGSDVQRLVLDPAPGTHRGETLLRLLFELVDRPEWRARHAVAREVSDVDGERFEVLVPVSPEAYRAGPRLVGPFPSQAAADEWGAEHAVSTLSYDTFPTGAVWLCDLFELRQDAHAGGDT